MMTKCILGFFLITSYWTKSAIGTKEDIFVRHLFEVALILRLAWVIGSYYYYSLYTGSPFGFETKDALGYHETAVWLEESSWDTAIRYLFHTEGVPFSDAGYPIWLTLIYRIFGPIVIIPRIIKALLGTWMCVLVYRLSARNFGEKVGKMAGIMCALMPNLIIYCGYHLKEVEMLFLEMAFLERLDFLLREKRINAWSIALTSILAFSLFLFRTVLGVAAVFTAVTAVLLSTVPSMKTKGKRVFLIGWGVLCIAVLSGGTIMNEIEGYWYEGEDNAVMKRYEQTLRGNQWAQYATSTVMMPMAFVLPFSTMVNVDQQYGQQEKHGGNYIRNFMGIFAILAIFEEWK